MVWQEALIREIGELLRGDAAVEALAVLGSGAQGAVDSWSDVDFLAVVQAEAFGRFFPDLEWLERLGPIYAFEQHPGAFSSVSRVCFGDMRRVDAIVTTVAALERYEDWPGLPFASGSRLVFSHNPAITRILGQSFTVQPPRVDEAAFAALANGFWFKAVIAVQKVVRGDRLVAFHLSLELIQEVSVLAMLLRDRELGTNVHRGGVGDEAVAEIETAARLGGDSAGILDSIEQSAVLFDRLGRRWSAGYEERREPLIGWIAAAQIAIK